MGAAVFIGEELMGMQLVWPLVDILQIDLGHEAPGAGERAIGGSILMFAYGVVVPVIAQNLLVAMLATTYQELQRAATLAMKVYRVTKYVFYTRAP